MNLTGQKVRQKRPKPPRDTTYMRWIKTLPCVRCKLDTGVDAAHCRIDWFTGGQKPPDYLTNPLCRPCHDLQGEGEVRFWNDLGVNPFVLASRLR